MLGRSLVSVAAVVIAVAFLAASCSSGRPSGLTAYGRVIWNLDALLHDVFGHRRVYVDYDAGGPGPPRGNFSTRFIAEAASRYYIFTFATARTSVFRAVRPPRPPNAHVGPAGWATPLTLNHLYISCGHREMAVCARRAGAG